MGNKRVRKEKEKETKWGLKRAAVGLLFLTVFVSLIYYANHDRPRYETSRVNGTEYETARVLRVLQDKTVQDESTENIHRGTMDLEVEILSGRYKGDIVSVTNYLSLKYNVYAKAGDTISLQINTTGENEYQVSVYNFNRKPVLIGMVVLFLAGLILAGGKKGLAAVAGIVFTLVSIVYILLPLLLKGFPAIPLTIGIVAFTTLLSFYLIGGIQPKTIAAFAGSMGGVAFAALLAYLASWLCQLTGFQMDEAENLYLVSGETLLKVKNLFICGVLIASIGAVMDVAMSISSAVEELKCVNRAMSQRMLFQSGMNIGRDAMGTMANTLIFAFAGTSLNMMLLIYSYDVSFTQLINTDFVAIEVIRGIAGSLGIVFTVPLSALISSVIVSRHNAA
ncbi:MAG: YibE/F family protein [Clostridiaceae bacterium]|nr:YibE/F family protein [Clostridiaceae bacterium]